MSNREKPLTLEDLKDARPGASGYVWLLDGTVAHITEVMPLISKATHEQRTLRALAVQLAKSVQAARAHVHAEAYTGSGNRLKDDDKMIAALDVQIAAARAKGLL